MNLNFPACEASAAADGEEKNSDKFSAEDFDRLLDDFIASEKTSMAGNEASEANEGDDTNASEDEYYSDYEDNYAHAPTMAEMLSDLMGLDRVKARLLTLEKVVQFNRLREDVGLVCRPMPLHAMFLGSPGTGKTTVARMMGEMLASLGALSKGHVVVRERSSLLGIYYSSESEKTREAIEEAQGGILFIDEAYQLFQPSDPNDPGRFVIETLLTALSDDTKRDWMLILAGYPDEMLRMFEMNPGLKSRIPDSNIYMFDDFSEGELMQIADNYLKRNSFTLSPTAREALRRRLHADYEARDRSFGNGRHVINLIETDIIPAMAVRVMNSELPDVKALSLIEACDIPSAIKKSVSANRARVGFRA